MICTTDFGVICWPNRRNYTMVREEDVIYRKGMSEKELQEAKKKTKEEHIKAYTGEAAFAGMLIFIAVSKLIIGVKGWRVGLWAGIGAGLGSILAQLEKVAREKYKKPKHEQKE
jgi:hypothetical protein